MLGTFQLLALIRNKLKFHMYTHTLLHTLLYSFSLKMCHLRCEILLKDVQS